MTLSNEDIRRCRESALLPETKENTIGLLERILHHRWTFDVAGLSSDHSPKKKTVSVDNNGISSLLWSPDYYENGTARSTTAVKERELRGTAAGVGTEMPSGESRVTGLLDKHTQKELKPRSKTPISLSIRNRQPTKSQLLREEAVERKMRQYKFDEQVKNLKFGIPKTSAQFPRHNVVSRANGMSTPTNHLYRGDKRKYNLTVSPELIGSTICLSNIRNRSEPSDFKSPSVKIHIDPLVMLSKSDVNSDLRPIYYGNKDLSDSNEFNNLVTPDDHEQTTNNAEFLKEECLLSRYSPKPISPEKNEQYNTYNTNDKEMSAMQQRLEFLESMFASQIQGRRQRHQRKMGHNEVQIPSKRDQKSANTSRTHTPNKLVSHTGNSVPNLSKRQQQNVYNNNNNLNVKNDDSNVKDLIISDPNHSQIRSLHNALLSCPVPKATKEYSSISLIHSIAENILGDSSCLCGN